MPTNDERKQIAARLREHQHGDVGSPTYEGGMIASWLRLKDALGAEGNDPQEDHTMMFGYLADLIEPEERTCRVVRKTVDIDGERMTDYTCCFNQPGWNNNYCPNCDAKVVE